MRTQQAEVRRFSAELGSDSAFVTICIDLTDVDVELALASGGYSLIAPVRLALMQALILAEPSRQGGRCHAGR